MVGFEFLWVAQATKCLPHKSLSNYSILKPFRITVDCFPCMGAHAYACASSYIDRHDVIFTFVIVYTLVSVLKFQIMEVDLYRSVCVCSDYILCCTYMHRKY